MWPGQLFSWSACAELGLQLLQLPALSGLVKDLLGLFSLCRFSAALFALGLPDDAGMAPCWTFPSRFELDRVVALFRGVFEVSFCLTCGLDNPSCSPLFPC